MGNRFAGTLHDRIPSEFLSPDAETFAATFADEVTDIDEECRRTVASLIKPSS